MVSFFSLLGTNYMLALRRYSVLEHLCKVLQRKKAKHGSSIPAFKRLKREIASLRLSWSMYHIEYQESQNHTAGPSLRKTKDRKEAPSLTYK